MSGSSDTSMTAAAEPRPAVTHDYTQRGWGHDITYRPEDGGKILRGSLWSPTRVSEGDYLILANGDRTTRYRVTEARWCVDPGDMYHFVAQFAPRV